MPIVRDRTDCAGSADSMEYAHYTVWNGGADSMDCADPHDYRDNMPQKRGRPSSLHGEP